MIYSISIFDVNQYHAWLSSASVYIVYIVMSPLSSGLGFNLASVVSFFKPKFPVHPVVYIGS